MSETLGKPRRRWLQVSLREWFLVAALLVVALGWWRKHSNLVAAVQQHEQIQKASDAEIFALIGDRNAALVRVYELTPDPEFEPTVLEERRTVFSDLDAAKNQWNELMQAIRSKAQH